MTLPKIDANKQALEIVDTASSSVRSLSYLLHPPLLDETGLRSALDWYVEGLAKRSGIKISLTITPVIFPRLSRDIETTIFRIVQEALTNVYRHSDSDSARVEIAKQPEWVMVRVRDYGKGLSSEIGSSAGPSNLGVGISGMRERVRQFGGDLTVNRSEPGTLVEAKIPLFG
jgi:two-component system NarL family sensor kinase